MFPFAGPPFLPFHSWARRAEDLWPSPLQILIHPEYGLWHAYRGALGFAQELELPPSASPAHPCLKCSAQPCLQACPTGAFEPGSFHAEACIDHLRNGEGGDCLDRGCRARRACPVGRGFVYPPAQARFHMSAFLSCHAGLQS